MNDRSSQVVDTLVWLRNDLRVQDNPALFAACEASNHVAAVYILTPEQWRSHDLSAARLGLTFAALRALNESLAAIGVKLLLLEAKDFNASVDVLTNLIDDMKVKSLYLNAEYAIDERRRDRAVKAHCRASEVSWHPHHGSIMLRPGSVLTQQGEAYKVFTPFKRAWMGTWSEQGRSAVPVPRSSQRIKAESLSLLDKFEASLECPVDLAAFPQNEVQAQGQLDAFANERILGYEAKRDLPAVEGTSRLSAALTIGLLSPVQCLSRARDENMGEMTEGHEGVRTWISELIWRDFYLHVMYAYPHISKGRAFRQHMDSIQWRRDKADFEAWCTGNTGFPIVDAAMRQLNTTGWMHNRLRMVTAMFLTKYLLIDWRWGEQYFMQHLADGHFGSNNGGWQWSASTGTDAAPYFRILSPIRQQERFDSEGTFIRRFVPELKSVAVKAIRKPGCDELLAAGYAAPVVDLKFAKERCLEAFKSNPAPAS